METIEKLAIEMDCLVVRLDAYEKYVKLLEFCERLGNHQRGVVRFRELNLVCFEKELKNDKCKKKWYVNFH